MYFPHQEFAKHVKKGRLVGLDLGTKTIGLALSDPNWSVVTPLSVINRRKLHLDLEALKKIFKEWDVVGCVLGLPMHQNGDEGRRCQATRQFSRDFEAFFPEIPICLWDERFTTAEAERFLIGVDMSRKQRHQNIDKMAAYIILKSAVDFFAQRC